MILVDSSAWIATLRDPSSSIYCRIAAILEDQSCTCGVIIQEVLQGVHDPRLVRELYERLSLLPYLEASRETSLAAARLFYRCRARGIKIHTVDALIMALAIQHKVPVLTLDTDFEKVAAVEHGLTLYE